MSEKILGLRRRYVGLTIYPPDVRADDVWAKVREVFEGLYGSLGLAESGLRRVRSGDRLVLACYHIWTARLVAALTLVESVGGQPISLDIYRISGTIKGVLGKR